MGDVVRRTAAVDDIVADVKTTLGRARARKWKATAEERLAPIVALIDATEARRTAARTEVAPLAAAIAAADDRADRLLGKMADDIWNDVGRPANDPALSLLFPGGVAYYADGEDDEQPDRMDLLAELLEAGVHPRLDRAVAGERAKAIRTEAALLRTAHDASRGPRLRMRLLERVRTALGRAAQMELAHLKRRFRAEGFSEAEIHGVIPDRPRPQTATEQESAPQTPATPAARAAE